MIRIYAIAVIAVMFLSSLRGYFQMKQIKTIATEIKGEVNELRKTVLELVEAGKIATSR